MDRGCRFHATGSLPASSVYNVRFSSRENSRGRRTNSERNDKGADVDASRGGGSIERVEPQLTRYVNKCTTDRRDSGRVYKRSISASAKDSSAENRRTVSRGDLIFIGSPDDARETILQQWPPHAAARKYCVALRRAMNFSRTVCLGNFKGILEFSFFEGQVSSVLTL